MKINKLMLLAAVAALMGSFALIGCTPKDEPAAEPETSSSTPEPEATSGDSATTETTEAPAEGDDHSGEAGAEGAAPEGDGH